MSARDELILKNILDLCFIHNMRGYALKMITINIGKCQAELNWKPGQTLTAEMIDELHRRIVEKYADRIDEEQIQYLPREVKFQLKQAAVNGKDHIEIAYRNIAYQRDQTIERFTVGSTLYVYDVDLDQDLYKAISFLNEIRKKIR